MVTPPVFLAKNFVSSLAIKECTSLILIGIYWNSLGSRMSRSVRKILRLYHFNHQYILLIFRDISMGKEQYGVPVVNDIDDGSYPTDFVYVIENIETTPMNVNRTITSLQHCLCRDDCSSLFCKCTRSSVQCWYDKVNLYEYSVGSLSCGWFPSCCSGNGKVGFFRTHCKC